MLLAASCTSDGGPAVPVEQPSRMKRPEVRGSDRLPCTNVAEQIDRARRGWVPVRAHDISLLPREPNYIGSAAKPVHTGPWDFLAEVPLLFYGPGVIGRSAPVRGTVTLADVAPSVARLIGSDFEAPDGSSVIDRHITGRKPRLVVTIVWDGGGWNALREHPRSWPFLKALIERGVLFEEAEIGSTPSNTPPIHTTLGTGAFPRTHGIPAVKMTLRDGSYVDPYEGHDADAVKVPTLADTYDLETDNRAKIGLVATVNWHLGMIGHGVNHPGGDRDLALLMNDRGEPYGNAAVYEIPDATGSLVEETATFDARDGARDGRWRGHDLSDVALRYASPAYVYFQERVLRSLIDLDGFGRDGVTDLLFTNFKSIDDAGHRWGMTSPETGEVISAADRALRDLVRFLDGNVGKSRWVLVLTADHGQTTYPEESGGWPIGGAELRGDANAALDNNDDGRDLVTRITSAGAFIDEDQLAPNELAMADVARWLAGYTARENLKAGASLPEGWSDRGEERLFDAVVIRSGRAFRSCADV